MPRSVPADRETRLHQLADWGVDLSLTSSYLRRTPDQRLALLTGANEGAIAIARSLGDRAHPALRHGYFVSPVPLFAQLQREGVHAVVIGVMGAILLGVPVTTLVLELCIRADLTNAERLVRALSPYMSQREAPLSTQQLLSTLGSKPLAMDTTICKLSLQSQVPGVGAFDAVQAASMAISVAGANVLILDLPAILDQLKARGVATDRFLIPQVEAALLMREQLSS